MVQRLQGLACLFLLFFSQEVLSFSKGFNQAWLKNNYGTQFLNSKYDKKYVEKLFELNKKAHSKVMRIWLYEGTSFSQFDFNVLTGQLTLRSDFKKNLTHFLETARKYNIKISLTFLDANVFFRFPSENYKRFWVQIFNQSSNERDEFYKNAILPIYQMVKVHFSDVVNQIDLVNEINALREFKMFESDQNLKSFVCEMKKNSPVPVTASLGWANAEEHFFNGLLEGACVDYFDIHLYNDEGRIQRCHDFRALASQGIHFQLGEFGQAGPDFNDQLQSHVTHEFLKQAKECGFRSALSWRLLDVREGHNPDARFSYFSFNKARPAFYVFRDF